VIAPPGGVQFVGAPWYGRNVMKSLLGAAVVSTVALAAGPAHALSVQEAILLASRPSPWSPRAWTPRSR